MIILWVILWILAAFLAVVLLFLLLTAVPVKYAARFSNNDGVNFILRASYLFKIFRCNYEYRAGKEKTDFYFLFFKLGKKKQRKKIRKQISSAENISEKNISEKIISEKKSAEKNPKKENFFGGLLKYYAVLTDRQGKTIMKQVFATVRKILKLLRPKHVEIEGTIGFECPYNTAMAMGAYETAVGIFDLRDTVRLAGEYNAEKTVVKINAAVRGKINIFRISIPAIQLLLHKPVRKFLLKQWRKEDEK